MLGQEPIANTLVHAIETGRIAHAYLFAGPRGVGKTSMARILAKALNCAEAGPTATPCNECDACRASRAGDDIDVIEIDGASNRGIDEVRDPARERPLRARARAATRSTSSTKSTCSRTEAFNALLKTLEEPPPHVKFIFATTEPQKSRRRSSPAASASTSGASRPGRSSRT